MQRRTLALAALVAILVLAGPRSLGAQSYTTVTASNLADASGSKLASGQICFLATDSLDNPISFQAGGGGQVVRRPACASVTNGAIAAGFQVANPAATNPSGIAYKVTVVDNSTGQTVLVYSHVTFSGATFNFDNYAPTGLATLPLAGGSVNGPLSVNGNLTVTGTVNFGALSMSNFAPMRSDNIRHADQFPGADAGAQINACVADLPAAGGTCDARGFQGPQTAAATVVLNKPVTLLLGQMTLTVAGNPGISVQSNGVHISGSSPDVSIVAQAAPGAHVISNVGGYSDFEVDHIRIVGVPGTVSVSQNNGIDVQGATRVNIHDNQFTGLQQEAMSIRNSTDVLVSGNDVWSVSDGIRLIGVQHARIAHNTIRNTQLPNTTFSAPFAVDSVSGTGFPNSTDLTFDQNAVINVVNSQAFLFHDGSNVTFTGNVGDNVSNLISVDPYAAPDACNNFTIAGNVYNGTTTVASQPANNGIYVNGQGPALPARHISITGNTVNNANAASQFDAGGGIGVNYADDVTVVGNTVRSPTGNGIVLGVDATRLNIRANNIVDVQPTPGSQRAGIELISGGSASGQIEGNSVDSATFGLRFDATSPGLYVGMNRTTNVTTHVLNGLAGQPPNVNLSMQYDGWVGVGAAPQFPLDVNEAYAGPTGTQIGSRSQITLAPASTDSTTSVASVQNTETASGNTQNFTGTLASTSAEFDHFGTGTVTSAEASLGIVTNRSTGTLSNAFGENVTLENLAGGSIANAQPFTSTVVNAGTGAINQAIAFYAQAPVNSGGGPPINTYFAFRADNPGSAVNTGYGFFSAAGLFNYFGGPVTIGGGNPITKVLQAQSALTVASIAPGTTSDNSITITGASTTNACFASPEYAVEPGLVWSCSVSATNTVRLRVGNITSAAITPAAGSNWRVWVLQE